jgi:hypothetical protein
VFRPSCGTLVEFHLHGKSSNRASVANVHPADLLPHRIDKVFPAKTRNDHPKSPRVTNHLPEVRNLLGTIFNTSSRAIRRFIRPIRRDEVSLQTLGHVDNLFLQGFSNSNISNRSILACSLPIIRDNLEQLR